MRISAEIVLLSTLSLFTLVGGMLVAGRELSALPSTFDRPGLMQLTSTKPVEHLAGFSTLSNNDALQLCREALAHPGALQMRYLSEGEREAIPPRCLALAQTIGKRSPLNALAWLVGAMAAANLEGWEDFNRSLVNAQATNPTQNWLAQLRIEQALSHPGKVDDATDAATRRDIEMLAQTVPGAALLANMYLTLPAAHDYLPRVLEATPPESQRRFLSAVARASRS